LYELYLGRVKKMPIYEYECTRCGSQQEVIQKFSDKPIVKCSRCSGKLQKLISQSSFHLKGSGWYVTDYSNKAKKTASSSENDGSSSKETKKTEKKDTKSSD
jgi:putative FmdB family regulatory protein